jgi:RHS repeat-associated protein
VGADLSGKLEGAGGIGGLLGIIEELPGGSTRSLLPIHDGLGNVTAVINAANNNVVARYDYGPFGEPLGETGEPDACPFRWQTKWYDRESEQYYFGYRYYDPRFGRWKSRDPMGEAGGFNLYAYCGNDPVNQHDPLGLAELDECAPSNEQITARLLQITAELGMLQDAGHARNAVDCIGWRPSQFVTAGPGRFALEGEQSFLQGVLRARAAIGPNGYGEFGVDKVLNREFGSSLDEGVLRYFTPKGGYVTSANMRANFRLTEKAAEASLNLSSLAIPLPIPRGLGLMARGSRVAAVESRLGPIIDMVPNATGTLVPAFEVAPRMLGPGSSANVLRERILANIAESQAARAASSFPSTAAQNASLLDITARASRITDRIIANRSTYWAQVYHNPALRGAKFAAAFAKRPTTAQALIRGNIMDDVVKQLAAKADLPFLKKHAKG